MTTLYFDCFSGISGDMVIGALLDAGADFVQMEEELKKLKIADEYSLSMRHVNKNGTTAVKFDVELNGEAGHDRPHSHAHDHSHADNHEHSHSHDHHHHDHRAYKQIVEMIEAAGFNDAVTRMALAIFKKIGEAEDSRDTA